jgi:hypothetical protein
MDKERDDIRREIDQTRDELSDQLAELAFRFEDAKDRARSMVRPRYWLERRPWLAIAGSVVAGYAAQRSVSRARLRRRQLRESAANGNRVTARLSPGPSDDVIARQTSALARQTSALKALSSRLGGLDSMLRQVAALEERAAAVEQRLAQSLEPVAQEPRGPREPREEDVVGIAENPQPHGEPGTSFQRQLAPFSDLARGAVIGIARALLTSLGRDVGEGVLRRRHAKEQPYGSGEEPAPYSPYTTEERPWIR